MTVTDIPAKPDNVKPVRNPLTGNEGKKAEVAPKPKPDIRIDRDSVRKAKAPNLATSPDGHKCVRVEYWLPEGHDYEDVKNPIYWSNVTTSFLKPISTEGTYAGSIICVRPSDHRFYAELYVTEVTKSSVYVEELFYKQFGPSLEDVKSDKWTVRWNEADKGYDIIRRIDKAIVGNAKDFRRLEAVQRWLKNMEG